MAAPDDSLLAPARWIGKRCTFAQALEEVEVAAIRAKIEAAGNNENVPSKGIEEYLRGVIGDQPGPGNHSPKAQVIRRHQTKACDCRDV